MNRKFCRSSSETLHDSISHEHVSGPAATSSLRGAPRANIFMCWNGPLPTRSVAVQLLPDWLCSVQWPSL